KEQACQHAPERSRGRGVRCTTYSHAFVGNHFPKRSTSMIGLKSGRSTKKSVLAPPFMEKERLPVSVFGPSRRTNCTIESAAGVPGGAAMVLEFPATGSAENAPEATTVRDAAERLVRPPACGVKVNWMESPLLTTTSAVA